jgi:hypothetical protein
MFFNITAISFTVSTLFAAAVTWRCFYILKKQPENEATEAFFKGLLFFTLYVGIRAIASIFFTDAAEILAFVYISSHIFLGLASAYLAKFATLSFFDLSKGNKIFATVCLFFLSDIILNILLPNQPHFNQQLNIIEWGTDKYVGIYHTVLLWLVFLAVALLFAYKGIKNWQDKELRVRSLVITAILVFSILVVVPRNIFHAPIFNLISDIGYTFSFGSILFAINYHPKKK